MSHESPLTREWGNRTDLLTGMPFQVARHVSQTASFPADDVPELELKAVDFSKECETNPADKIISELLMQFATVGFLKIKNLEGFDEDRYLMACQMFHNLPMDRKRKLLLAKDNPANPNNYRGYLPFVGNDPSHKEMYDMGMPRAWVNQQEWNRYFLYEDTPFPQEEFDGELQWIQHEFENTFKIFQGAGHRLANYLACGLGKRADFFDPWFVGGNLSTLRSIRYLPRSAGVVDSSMLDSEQSQLVTPPHSDSGLLTILCTFGYPGLQVLTTPGALDPVSSLAAFTDERYQQGEEQRAVYQPVKACEKNEVVVNLGDLFARISGYRLKATYHQVADIGTERYSSPMFVDPPYSAQVPLGLLLDPQLEQVPTLDGSDSQKTGACHEASDERMPLFGDVMLARMMQSYVEWDGFEVKDPIRRAAIEQLQFSGNLLANQPAGSRHLRPKL